MDDHQRETQGTETLIEIAAAPAASVPPRSAFAPGAWIDGRYLIERELATGGVGVVVLAIDTRLGRLVAIKYLQAKMRGDRSVVERFRREAGVAASLRCEHVVRIHDVGTAEDGTPYMVMEYLEGQDLAAVLSHGGPLPVERAVDYTLQACAALAEAHALGIVHRDLKPENLFLCRRSGSTPIVKILDFGISKAGTSRWEPRMTADHESFGTPCYMSPEQLVSSANVDARSDVWAMGVVLYELLTGRLPFEGSDLRTLVARVLSSPPTPLRERRTDLPVELEGIVHACLSFRASDRPRDIAALARRLRELTIETSPPSKRGPSSRRGGSLLGALAVLATALS